MQFFTVPLHKRIQYCITTGGRTKKAWRIRFSSDEGAGGRESAPEGAGGDFFVGRADFSGCAVKKGLKPARKRDVAKSVQARAEEIFDCPLKILKWLGQFPCPKSYSPLH